MISWLPAGLEYSAADVAIEDINSNPDILPNTFLDYEYVFHNLDAAVSSFKKITKLFFLTFFLFHRLL